MKQFSRTLPMINAVENARRGDISTQSQCVKPCTDHWDRCSLGQSLDISCGMQREAEKKVLILVNVRNFNVNMSILGSKRFKIIRMVPLNSTEHAS